MAATPPKTMVEVLASSMPPLNNTASGSNNTNIGGTAPTTESKDDNDSSNVMIKTFPFLTITVYIPTACVGVLIGKRGSNIDSIQKLAAKQSTKLQTNPRGPRNKNSKLNKNNPKAVSPDSVRISVVNYPPPPSNSAHNYEQYFTNLHDSGLEPGHASNSNQQQTSGATMVDMSVPPTYTELDFSDPQWTPIVIRADPIAAIHAANAIHDICCPEYVVERNLLVYIIDVPIPAVAPAASNNANLRHASIVGKRGNKLIQLSAEHKCRIMVPPKQLGHDIIQLEAPLKECCSCLKAIMGKLQAGGSSDDKEGDATKISPSSPQTKNAKNNAKGNNTNNKSKNDNSIKNSFQTTLIIQPLPSQTKLRNIARKTDTKILKKRMPKSQQRSADNNPKPTPAQQEKQEEDVESKQIPEHTTDETEALTETSDKQESGSGNSSNTENKFSWRLTILGTTEKKVSKAVDFLKVLNSKGYELVVEEPIVNNNSVDTSNKSVPEGTFGGSESDTDMIIEDATEGAKPASIANGHGGRGGGRGGRKKPKPRYRNNHRGNNNGKDNNGNAKLQAPPATPTVAVSES